MILALHTVLLIMIIFHDFYNCPLVVVGILDSIPLHATHELIGAAYLHVQLLEMRARFSCNYAGAQ